MQNISAVVAALFYQPAFLLNVNDRQMLYTDALLSWLNAASQAELLSQLEEEDAVKQKANKGRAAKKAKKKAKPLPATAADAAAPVSEAQAGSACADAGDCAAQAGAGVAGTDRAQPGPPVQHQRLFDSERTVAEANTVVQSDKLDLDMLSLAEHHTAGQELSHGLPPPQPAAEQWEVQSRSRRAAGKKAVPQVPQRNHPTVLEIRKADLRRPSATAPTPEMPSRQGLDAEKLVSPALPQSQVSPTAPQVTGRWAAVVAGRPLPQPPITPPLQSRPSAPSVSGFATSGMRTPQPPPPAQHSLQQAAPWEAVSQITQPWAALQTAATEPAADVSRASSYSLWGGGMSDFSRASLPLSSSRDSLSAISDGSFYGSPPTLGSQQLGAGLAALQGTPYQRSKPPALSPLFAGKAGAGIWSAFSLGPVASPFGGVFTAAPAAAGADPTLAVARQDAVAAFAAHGGCHESQQSPQYSSQMLS